MKILRILKRKDGTGMIIVAQEPSESTETILRERGINVTEILWEEHDIFNIPVSKGRFDILNVDSSSKRKGAWSTIHVQ